MLRQKLFGLTARLFSTQPSINKLKTKESLSTSSSLINKLSNYGWQIDKYYINEEFNQDQLQFNEQMKLPIIFNPNDLLIEVKATSVNPLDLVRIKGYGREIIDNLNVIGQIPKCKLTYDKFPLVLGRDFAGVVRNVGANVNKFKVGDEIWGSVSPFKQGCHCKYVIASESELDLKPKNLSFEEAASLPYVALTSWSALFKFGNFTIQNAPAKKILILGGSGGMGTFTVQLLKAYDCSVSVTCAPDAIDFMNQIVDLESIYDYNDFNRLLNEKEGHFDYVLDYASRPPAEDQTQILRLLKRNPNSYYITTRSPLMKNADNNGLLFGLLKSLIDAGETTFNGFKMRTNARWAYYESNQSALQHIRELCETDRIRPIVQRCFEFDQLPQAYQAVNESGLRGKIVIKM